jgi:tetratricopeptide (TPR) repeat protein
MPEHPSIPPSLAPDETPPEATGAIVRPQEATPGTDTYEPSAQAPSKEAPAGLGGRYELLGEVGRGGMGAVLRGRDRTLGRDLAIKVLLGHHADHPEVVQRFVEEAQVGGQLQHPGVVPVYDLGLSADHKPYFTMKLVKGDTLSALLRQRSDPAQDRPRFLGIFLQVCQAVAYAHSRGVIHRDLKPSNVMVGAFGEVQVMDWGLAKVLRTESVVGSQFSVVSPDRTTALLTTENRQLTTERTRVGDVLGTPAYMPPEQARGELDRLDERCDVFSLGGVLCTILTGQPPYADRDGAVALRRAQRADLTEAWERLDNCGADAELTGLARRCLAAETLGRPRDAGEVAREVERYQAGVEERARQAELERAAALAREEEARGRAAESERRVTAERRARRLTAGLAAAALLLVLAGGGGAWYWQQRRATADAETRMALAQGRSRLEEGWKQNDKGLLEAAVTEADKALKLAQSGASEALRQEAAELCTEAQAKFKQAQANIDLLADLLNVDAGRETRQYVRGPSGSMMALPEPSVDQQFAQAFQHWDKDCDFDRTPLETLVRRLGEQPEAVVQEVVAGLDTWLLDRRRRAVSWRRLFQVAEELDRDPDSRALRQALVSGTPEREAALRRLTRLFPWPAVAGVSNDKQRQWFREQAARAAGPRTPARRLVLLARALVSVGEAKDALQLMRKAVLAQPNRELLLDALGRFLEQQGSAYREEAIGYHRAARALRPQLGVNLGGALRAAGHLEEAREVFVLLRQKQPSNPEISLALAAVLYDQKKLAEAEKVCRQTIQLQPRLALAHNNLGAALDAQKKWTEAEAAWRKALELQPDLALAYLNLGVLLHDRNKLVEAEAACRQALKYQPDLAPAYSRLGCVLCDRKQLEEAEAACRKALQLQPDSADAFNNLGLVLRNRNRLAEAEVACRKAIQLQPDNPDAHCSLGSVLTDLKRLPEAEAACRKAIQLQPDFAMAHGNLGVVLLRQKKLAEAESACRKAIELQPDLALAHHNLGMVLHEQKKPTEAEAACRKAIELQPDFALAYSFLARLLREQLKPAEAETACRKAIELQPDLAEAYLNLGVLLHDQRKLAEAEPLYRKAIALQPDLAPAYYNFGKLLYEQKRLAEAETAFRKAIALQPDLTEAHVEFGILLWDQRKLAEAETAFRKAIALRPTLALAHNNLGMVLRARKKLPEAETAYRRAIALRPDYANAYNGLGLALQDQKKLPDAEAAFRKSIQLQPNRAVVHRNLGNVLRARKKPPEAEVAYRKCLELAPDHAEAHCSLGLVLSEEGRFAEALASLRRGHALGSQRPGWPYPSAQWVMQAQQVFDLDSRLAAVLAGKVQPKDARELFNLGLFCARYRKRYATAVGLFTDAFAADPRLSADLNVPYRMTAVHCVALAVAGKGKDAGTLNDQKRTRLRKQALDWLRADLEANTALAGKADSRRVVQQRLAHWLKDDDLAGVRDDKFLAGLPEPERKEWRKLWADIGALLKKVEDKR